MQVVVLTVQPKRCQTRRLSSYALAQGMLLCHNSTRLQIDHLGSFQQSY